MVVELVAIAIGPDNPVLVARDGRKGFLVGGRRHEGSRKSYRGTVRILHY